MKSVQAICTWSDGYPEYTKGNLIQDKFFVYLIPIPPDFQIVNAGGETLRQCKVIDSFAH